jgi:hypothetical protein
VAATLAGYFPATPFKDANHFAPTHDRKLRHYTVTSTC